MTITDIYEVIRDGIFQSLNYFILPNKRVYIPFLLSSLFISYLVFKYTNVKGSFKDYVLNKKVWLSTSSFVDYGFLLFNGVFKILAIGPWLILGLYLAFYTKEFFLDVWGYPKHSISNEWIIILYTIVLFTMKDFSSYIVHGLFHKISFLWRFHKVHHSALVLNPITQYRIHPIELVVNNLKGVLVFGVVTGFFDFLSDGTLQVLMILGVNVIGFLFMFFGANLRHSHVKLRYPIWMESWLISPVQHQVHHSDRSEHFDKNFGSVLAVWDRMFGTLIKSNEVGRIRFGLGRLEGRKMKSFWQNLIEPFK